MLVVECGPFRGVARGEAGEVSYGRGHVVEKRVFVSRGGGCAVVFVFFLRAHFPRKVPHRVFVDSELDHGVDVLCFCVFFVFVHFLRESPPESVLPALMGEVV